jgi:proline dehydrogenase
LADLATTTTIKQHIIMSNPVDSELNFGDTAIAFERKNDKELSRMAWLFGLMNRPWLVSIGSRLTRFALLLHLPVQWLIRKTIFQQFCGGTDLADCATSVKKLADYNVKTVLDYGVEAKDKETDFDNTVEENIRAIRFAALQKDSVPIISTKVSGLCRFDLFEKISAQKTLTAAEQAEWTRAEARLEKICIEAADHNMAIFVDAEESWVQAAIDELAMRMMRAYNRQKVVVYNTFQLYRHDRLAFLKDSHAIAEKENFLLGAKLVRGAYMEKERARAKDMGYPSPIQTDKAATDKDYDLAVRYCVDNRDGIASCLASHNQQSTLLQTQLIAERALDKLDPHLTFCQLYGMSDNLTFNLAKAGFQVSKYVPYGAVREVIPYLLRRAQENTSVGGDVSRELNLIQQEQQRRRKAK